MAPFPQVGRPFSSPGIQAIFVQGAHAVPERQGGLLFFQNQGAEQANIVSVSAASLQMSRRKR
jgi:hypothetical protein